ncbi:AcrR family transcriptional regulator [Rhodoferax ferrireducens]|uniref:AcrR family transcriptional regulator n=1 Tax=Rhodoferax ferrireducens TaxID=192843 RepID=A0ABU2CA38_9BURK|nr:TetR/AcrR family transcriptional regulator [Rhodoferax ferrireducens]MDR7378180.1 AcrR family transcriptional regulator [Rhodoferax ferrireducens]
MARPRSEDKHAAILDAAVRVVAERGLSATPTSAISKAAGVAEGTLFTYFKTKDALVNALYLDIKREMAGTMMAGFPRHAAIRQQLQHVWDHYVEWGVAQPAKKQVMAQLHTSAYITAESRAVASAPFAEIEQVCKASIASQVLRDYPVPFIWACMSSLAEATIGCMVQDPQAAASYQRAGFEVLWNGIAFNA